MSRRPSLHRNPLVEGCPAPASASSTDGGPRPDTAWQLLTKARRRVKIQHSEWKYQVAQVDGEWWVNKVGAYGMASAQLYWGWWPSTKTLSLSTISDQAPLLTTSVLLLLMWWGAH